MSAAIAVRVPKKTERRTSRVENDFADDVRKCLERKVKTEKLSGS